MEKTSQSSGRGVGILEQKATAAAATKAAEQQIGNHAARQPAAAAKPAPTGKSVERMEVTPKKGRLTSPSYMVAYFAILNVVMYLTIQKFWIGGSSFLPMLGKLGPENKFLLALLVNVGVIIGAFIGARSCSEFRLRLPRSRDLPKAVIGGMLIGMGVTIAPGTCTTAFVTGVPMLSVSSFLSIAGIFIGSQLVFRYTLGRR